MKKILIVFGLAAGVIISAWILASVALCTSGKMDMDMSMVLGYTCMILAFSFIFVAVKKYRDGVNGGFISFGKAFSIGLYITLIASTFYVAAWLVDYYVFFPDFAEQYAAKILSKAQASGATAEEMAKKTAEMAEFNKLYKNPVFVVLMTYVEVLPVGLLVSLLAAAILRKKRKAVVVGGS